MAAALQLPVIDLSATARVSIAASIRQACIEYGFFYLVNAGLEKELLDRVFEESKKFFSLPLEEKMKLGCKDAKEQRGYTPLYADNLDPTSSSKDEEFFEKVGALDKPMPFLRLLHYPGDMGSFNEEIYGAYAHSDYGMITLLATDGVPGLQVCREKSKQPRVWEDVLHVDGALIVNIGDMMERWTNCLFGSTLHRVMPTGNERYSAAFFLNPNPDCLVECLKSCCSASSAPRYPPIRSGDYLEEKLRLLYSS